MTRITCQTADRADRCRQHTLFGLISQEIHARETVLRCARYCGIRRSVRGISRVRDQRAKAGWPLQPAMKLYRAVLVLYLAAVAAQIAAGQGNDNGNNNGVYNTGTSASSSCVPCQVRKPVQ